MAKLIDQNNRPTKVGTAHGGQYAAAKTIGVSHSALGQVMNGHANPGRKILDYFGLETRVIYVAKTQNQ